MGKADTSLVVKTYYKSIKELKGEGTIWALALRKNTGKKLYENNYSGFVFIKNSFLYWRADPFLYEYNGETFLFAELFHRIKGKGVIGVAKVKNGKCGKFKVCLNLPYHLSYPCVFEDDGDIYMVPECARSKKISVYKAVNFPCRWEESYVLYDGPGVDTTPVPNSLSNKLSFITTLRINDNKENNCLYAVSRGDSKKLLLNNDYTVRSAGHFFKCNNDFFRPSQDCTDSYGGALVFKKLIDVSLENYKEETYKRICPDDIRVNEKRYVFNGIHTYNKTDEYEVIDLSYDVGKSVQYILKKIKRHFNGN